MDKERYYGVEYEEWESSPHRPKSFRDKPFFLPHTCLRDQEDAQRYADNNRGNYPYCTTGRVVEVEVTIKPAKS